MEATETIRKETTQVHLETLVERIYEPAFYQVAVFVSRNKGSVEDARDIFHDAVVIFYEHVTKGKVIHSDIGYLVGIAKHLWLRELKQTSLTTSIEIAMPDEIFIEEGTPNQLKLVQFLERAGKRCMELLVSFYLEKIDIQKLVQRYGFSSDHSASVQKYKCIEKIRETIKSKSIAYEDFLD